MRELLPRVFTLTHVILAKRGARRYVSVALAVALADTFLLRSMGVNYPAHLCGTTARKTLEIIPEAIVFPYLWHPCLFKRADYLFRCEYALRRSSCL